jgi:hypothetical protein
LEPCADQPGSYLQPFLGPGSYPARTRIRPQPQQRQKGERGKEWSFDTADVMRWYRELLPSLPEELVSPDRNHRERAAYRWSVDHPERFWPAVWAFSGVKASAAWTDVLRNPDRMPGARWFVGARLNFADGDDPELAAIYEQMLRRVSNRHQTNPAPLPDDVVPALREAARAEGADVAVVTDRDRLAELSEVFGESDRLRFLTPQLHSEMMRELRWPGIDSLNWGLDVRTLELDRSDLAKLEVARRADIMTLLAEQDVGRALGDISRDLIKATSALVVVTITGSDVSDYVRGGQAVERTWIRAEQLGLSVQAMSPVFIYAVDQPDYEELSPRYAGRLRQLHQAFNDLTGIGARRIALTMRIGYAPEVTARSRRLPAERTVRVIEEHGA